MTRANQEIRSAIKESGVFTWQVADAFGMSESGFCKKLRFELSPGEKQKIISIIEELSRGNHED